MNGCARRRRCALARRYGRFRLPTVRGASAVTQAKRRDVSWLARTDTIDKTVEFSEHFAKLSPEGKRYIVLHERAHLETGPDHDVKFYDVLRRLVKHNNVSWEVAYELESYNCFGGLTRFWADGELVAFKDKVGQTVNVLAGDGEWRAAKVESFGRKRLFKYVFGPVFRSRFELAYLATSDHRWVTSNRGEVTDLRVGDRVAMAPRRIALGSDYALGRVHGLVFGDGAATTGRPGWYQIRLCGAKNMAFLPRLMSCVWYASHSFPASYDGDAHVRFRSDTNLKCVPVELNLDYQAGFLRGWLDADAYLHAGGSYRLDVIDHEALAWIVERAPLLGMCVSGKFIIANEVTNLGRRTRRLMRLTLTPSTVEYAVKRVEDDGVEEETYCVVEPVTSLFTLDGGLVTGNCHHRN